MPPSLSTTTTAAFAASTSSALLYSYSLVLLLLLSIHSSSASSKHWKQWSCDQLTPNLCELQVESGSVVIQSIPVHYWRYSRVKEGNEPPVTAATTTTNSSSISHSIIALHGGPGWPHSYLLPLKQLACRGDTAEVIFYDQAGCGKSVPSTTTNASTTTSSSSFQDQYPHLLDPAYYSEIELPTLIDHWKLHRYHVLGHSWGTILAQMFALNYNINQHSTKHTTATKNNNNNDDDDNDKRGKLHSNQKVGGAGGGLQSLILSGPISNAKAYISAQWDAHDTNNLASLPPFIQYRIHALEDAAAYDTPEYKAIEGVLSTFFTMRTNPVPDCFEESAVGVNEGIYVGMQGASEFTISGVLGDLDLTPRLHELTIPVLLTHGKFDTMRPSTVKAIQDQIPISERVMFPHSGHVSMIDDAGLMNDVVASFIHRVEEGGDIGGERNNEVVGVVGGEAAVATDSTVAKSTTLCRHSWSWIKVVIAFLAGFLIGELKIGRRRTRDGYTSV